MLTNQQDNQCHSRPTYLWHKFEDNTFRFVALFFSDAKEKSYIIVCDWAMLIFYWFIASLTLMPVHWSHLVQVKLTIAQPQQKSKHNCCARSLRYTIFQVSISMTGTVTNEDHHGTRGGIMPGNSPQWRQYVWTPLARDMLSGSMARIRHVGIPCDRDKIIHIKDKNIFKPIYVYHISYFVDWLMQTHRA